MKTALIGACVLFALHGFIGCQVDRTSFQFNSDTQVPSLGLQLVPKREPQKIQTVGHHDRRAHPHQAKVLESDQSGGTKRSRWTQWFSRFGRKKRIPLPRTDLPSRTEFRQSQDGFVSNATPDDDF